MTSRERVVAMLEGRVVDRLPCMPITMMFAADCLGVKYGQYARDHRILAEGQVKTAELFEFDHVSAISDPAREAADCGAKIEWSLSPCRSFPCAVELTSGREPALLGTLAAAYAEAGRFDKAVELEKRAADLATQQGNAPLAGILRSRLTQLQAKTPIRQP